MFCGVFCFQAEDGIRDLVRSRGLGDVYKRQGQELGRGGHVGKAQDLAQPLVLPVIAGRQDQPAILAVKDLSLIHI